MYNCGMSNANHTEKRILVSSNEIILRSPKLGDAQSFSEYINALVNEDTYLATRKQSVKDEAKYISNLVKEQLEGKEVHIIAMILDKKIGAIDIFRQDIRQEHVGELELHILKSYRGIGLGKILLREALDQAKLLNFAVIRLWYFEGNNPARHLYENFGFKEYGRLPHGIFYKGKFIDQILMYLEL